MRVRVAIGLAVLATLIGLLIDMSGSAPRGAGDDHISPQVFADVVPGGGVLCQAQMVLPGDAGIMRVLIGTYGKRTPRISVSFRAAGGRTLALGALPAGTPVSGAGNEIHLRYPHGPSVAGSLCLRVAGRNRVAFAGYGIPASAAFARIDGRPQAGRIAVSYLRPGSESWWQLLGALDLRFGLGKSTIFGDWTLPVLALVVLAMWAATVRFLIRELRS